MRVRAHTEKADSDRGKSIEVLGLLQGSRVNGVPGRTNLYAAMEVSFNQAYKSITIELRESSERGTGTRGGGIASYYRCASVELNADEILHIVTMASNAGVFDVTTLPEVQEAYSAVADVQKLLAKAARKLSHLSTATEESRLKSKL